MIMHNYEQICAAVRADAPGFIAACEARYEQAVRAAAEQIARDMEHSRVVFLSGPSGSGKTTTAKKLAYYLKKAGISTHTISMDDYFVDVDERTAPRNERGELDFESPECLDAPLLRAHFRALAAGEEIRVPQFSFAKRARDGERERIRLGACEVAIFEGIHALNDALTAGVEDRAKRVYVSARSNVRDAAGKVVFKGTWLRILRRSVRDTRFRATDIFATLAMWENIRRGEKKYISPYKSRADITIDTAFAYEPCVLAAYIPALLGGSAVPPHIVRHDEIIEMLARLRQFPELAGELVPGVSLLREFIGDSKIVY